MLDFVDENGINPAEKLLQKNQEKLNSINMKILMKKDFFKQNPHLIEFAKKLTTSKTQDDNEIDASSNSAKNNKKKKDQGHKFGPG